MKMDEKELIHWRKRKFDSALVIGENLVTIRKMFGKDDSGFRKLVETEFGNNFCYKTSKRGSSLFPVGTGGLDAHGMMTGDDTGGDVWTVAGAWEGLACSRGAA